MFDVHTSNPESFGLEASDELMADESPRPCDQNTFRRAHDEFLLNGMCLRIEIRNIAKSKSAQNRHHFQVRSIPIIGKRRTHRFSQSELILNNLAAARPSCCECGSGIH